MAADPSKAIDPGHCCVCGREGRRRVCAGCRRDHRGPDGKLPTWLTKGLENPRRSEDRDRQAQRKDGITVESFEQLFANPSH